MLSKPAQYVPGTDGREMHARCPCCDKFARIDSSAPFSAPALAQCEHFHGVSRVGGVLQIDFVRSRAAQVASIECPACGSPLRVVELPSGHALLECPELDA